MTVCWAGVLGRGPGGQQAIPGRCGCRLGGGGTGALVKEPVDGVQRVGRVKVGVGEQGTPGGQNLGVDAARGGRGGDRPPRGELAHSWVVTALTSV